MRWRFVVLMVGLAGLMIIVNQHSGSGVSTPGEPLSLIGVMAHMGGILAQTITLITQQLGP